MAAVKKGKEVKYGLVKVKGKEGEKSTYTFVDKPRFDVLDPGERQ
jgi:hypothetical protein